MQTFCYFHFDRVLFYINCWKHLSTMTTKLISPGFSVAYPMIRYTLHFQINECFFTKSSNLTTYFYVYILTLCRHSYASSISERVNRTLKSTKKVFYLDRRVGRICWRKWPEGRRYVGSPTSCFPLPFDNLKGFIAV